MGRGYLTAAVRRTMGYPMKGYVPMGIRQSMSANQYPVGLEKYKYNPKFMPIPMETNGIVHIDEKGVFSVHDLTQKSEFPTNVDISELPYEVGLYFNKNGMPLVSYTYNYDTKESNTKDAAYVFTSKIANRLATPYRHPDDEKDTIFVHNHPSPVAFSGPDIWMMGSDSLYKAVVRPEQIQAKQLMNELLKNKKKLLANYKTQIENSGYPLIRYNEKTKTETFIRMHEYNDVEKKTVQNMYDFVKSINKKNLNKFVYYETSNLKEFSNYVDKNRSYKENGKRKYMIDTIRNDWVNYLDNMVLPTWSRKHPTKYSAKNEYETISFLDVIKTNFAMANKYKYTFEVKYA